LRNYADVVHRHTGIDISNKPSSGSGGGVTLAAEVFLGAEVRYGIDVVLEKINFESKLEGVDLVIVAEGQLDAQTIYNKAPIGVAKIAKNRNIPVICVSAVLGDGYEESFKHGVDALVGIASDNSWVDKNSIVNENDIVNAIHDVFMQIKVNNFKIETGTEYSPRRSE
jgi:glycerate kinase